MIEVYLNFNGQAREAANYYAGVFGAPAPYIMAMGEMPKESPEDELPAGSDNLVAYANVKTFAGDLMLSDDFPGGPQLVPNGAFWIPLSHEDRARLRQVFDALARDGQVLMPLAPTFFNPLYGQVKDRYGFHWMVMVTEDQP